MPEKAAAPTEDAPTFKAEPRELSALVLDKIDPRDPRSQFVKHRFWRPFEHSVVSALRYSVWFTVLTVLVIAGGVSSSLLSQTEWAHVDVLIASSGLLVAIAAVNRLWRPGLRSAVRNKVANELRREGWRFVCDEGQYETSDDKVGTFFKEVERINAPAEAIDETPGEGGES
jgi:hypothetical protein